MGATKGLPHGWKEAAVRDGHLDCLKTGIQAMNAVTHRAEVIVSTVLKLSAEDQRLAQVYAEAGLPPVSPLVSHAMLVETRNHVFGALFPGPEKSLLHGTLDGYTVNQGNPSGYSQRKIFVLTFLHRYGHLWGHRRSRRGLAATGMGSVSRHTATPGLRGGGQRRR